MSLVFVLIISVASVQADVLRQNYFSGATEGEGGFDTIVLSQGSDWNLGVADEDAEDGLVATARDQATSGDSRLILIQTDAISEFGDDPSGKGWVFSVRFKVNEGLSTSSAGGRPYAAFGIREENSNGKGCWPGLYNHDGQTSIRFTSNGGDTWTGTPGGDIPDIAGDGKFHTFTLWKYNKDGVTVVAVWMDDELVLEVNYADLPDDDSRGIGVQGLASGTPVELCDVAVDTIQFTLYDNLEQSKPSRAFASVPSPSNRGNDVLRDTILSWKPGQFAARHDVYLGTVWDDVNDASTAETLGVLVSEGQAGNSYDAGVLDFGQIYYWRIDEVNGAPDNTVFKGEVWSFTVEPFSIPVETISVTASSSNAANMGPENTINGVGLNALDQHSTEATEMWLSGMDDPAPMLQYEFDKPYKLHEMWVWNSNQPIEAFVGIGAKDVVIEYSLDGAEWTILEGVTQFAQATGAADYAANTTVDFGGALAQYVRIAINAGYGILPQYGLAAVRFLYIPTFARQPIPADQAVTEGADVELAWRAGREAAQHEVYLGTDEETLTLLDITDTASIMALALDYDTTYYWQVIEINETQTPSAYTGPVWSFTTPPYDVIDDFESYDDDCNRIFFAWADGLGHGGGEDIEDCDVVPSNGNGTGSIVGNAMAPFAEKTTVYSGSQSMPLEYDNSVGQSEATLTLDGQDWTASGIKTLCLRVFGATDNTGQLYLKINNTRVGGAPDISQAGWQAWYIDLTGLSGLQNVTSLTIGIDGASAVGMLYIDDIRLYPVAADSFAPTAGGLLHNWTFDSDLTDGVGGKDATAFGDAGVQTTTSKIGAGAAAFDGSGDYMTAGTADDFSIGTGAMSVSFWLNVADADKQTSDRFLSNGAGNNTQAGWTFFMRTNAAGTIGDGVDAGMSDGGGRRILGTNANDTIDALDGNWHLLVGVFDYNGGNGKVDIYLDSVLETTIALADLGTWNGSSIDNTHALTLGAISANPNSNSLNGLLDDVAIWAAALSQDQIDALWNGGAGQAAALIAGD